MSSSIASNGPSLDIIPIAEHHQPTASPSKASRAEKTVTEMGQSVTVHKEHHVGHGEFIRNGIIGFSDGLTVPFALCAGLSSVGQRRVVILGGLAELFAGAISMGIGAYLAATTARTHYDAEKERERREVQEEPQEEEEEIFQILGKYGVSREQAQGVVQALSRNEEMWVEFMMDFELQMERPGKKAALIEAFVMALSYFLGGILPMIPYFIFPLVNNALYCSIAVTCFVLIIFGYVKAKIIGLTRKAAWLSALQALLIGTSAAGTAYLVVWGVNQSPLIGGNDWENSK